jgi:MFS family permease
MYAIIFLQGFVFYGPVATLFRQARGLSMSEIFIIESISWILIIMLEVPWGWISDKFGYKKTLIVVNTLFFISKIVFYKAHSFESFLIERIMLSVVLAGLSGCDTALIYASIKESDAQKVFGKYSAFGTLGFLISSVLSTFIVAVSLDYTALLTIFPYGLSVVMTLFLAEVKLESKDKSSVLMNFKRAFADKSVLLFVFSIALVIEVVQAVTVFLNQAQYLRSGIDPMYFGLIVAGIQCARLMSVKASVISGKLGNINAISLLVSLIMGSCLLLALTTNPMLSITCVVIIALSMSVIGPIELDVKNKFIRGNDRATSLSMYSMVGGLIASVGNIIVGKAADQSLQHGLLICILMSIVSLILLRFYSKCRNINRIDNLDMDTNIE